MHRSSLMCVAVMAAMSALATLTGCNNNSSSSSSDSATPAATQAASTSAPAAANLTIAVIPKGTTHEYWKSVQAGADQAGKELGVNIIWKGPLKEDDRAQQIELVEQFVSEGVSGIVLAPLDDKALVRPVTEAKNKNIPVVIIDSALNAKPGTDFVSFVSTDNRAAGAKGGEALAKLLDGKGKVVLLRYAVGSASTDERESGFLDVMKKNPGITMLVDNRYGGATAAESKTASLNMLDKIQQADGIFCPNESTTFGMLLALRQANLAGKIKFVGFDATPDTLDGLKKGEINAIVTQNPVKMGYDGVTTMVNHLRGKETPTRIDTGSALVTRENLDAPEIKAIIGG